MLSKDVAAWFRTSVKVETISQIQLAFYSNYLVIIEVEIKILENENAWVGEQAIFSRMKIFSARVWKTENPSLERYPDE